MRRLAIALASLCLAACLDAPVTDSGGGSPSDPATETFTGFNPPIVISEMTKTALGDYYKDLKVGTGPALAGPQVVIFTYETFLKTGVIVDQQIGVQQDLTLVVRGLQDGLIGMQAGGERIIVVPSANAFGSFTKPPIPANSTLVYDVIMNTIP